MNDERDSAERGRSFVSGREVYLRTSCLECHRIAGDGGGTGPDLTGTGNRFRARRDHYQIARSPNDSECSSRSLAARRS